LKIFHRGILYVEDLPGVEDVVGVQGPFDRPGHVEISFTYDQGHVFLPLMADLMLPRSRIHFFQIGGDTLFPSAAQNRLSLF
jgi:hypothetical protein